MAASQGPATITASTYTPEKAWGRHIFEINRHSLLKGIGVGEFIRSPIFTVGGYDWCVIYYPDGEDDDYGDYASVYLQLMSETYSKVRVLFNFIMAPNRATGALSLVHTEATVFDAESPSWGAPDFVRQSDLEASYLQDDRIVIECDLTIILGTRVSKPKSICDIQVPPSDVLHSLGKLLESADGADLKLKVEDEVFHAHKIVLAMRSPVFKAELFGPMSGKGTKKGTLHIIEDMHPPVFKALLHFMYNDSVPAMDALDGHETEELAKHLLVAADRYAVERLKVICESILSKKLDVENVTTTLALADQHHCSQLKNACIEFISSSNRLDEVVESKGYAHLKRACPTVIAEIWEKSAKSRKI